MIYLKDLSNIKDEKVYEFFYENVEVKDNLFIRSIKDCDGYFIFYIDESDRLKIEYKIVGKMICPDAYTMEDVEVPFELEDTEDVITKSEDEGILLQSKTAEEELIRQIILPIVPIKVVKSEKIEYSKGCGWSFCKEEDVEHLDSRLEEFKKLSSEKER